MGDRIRFAAMGFFAVLAVAAVLFLVWGGGTELPPRGTQAASNPTVAPMTPATPGPGPPPKPDPVSARPEATPAVPAQPPEKVDRPQPTAGGSMEGIVVNEHGTPLSRMYVAYADFLRVDTDDKGRFAIGGLDPGTYELIPMPLTARGENTARLAQLVDLAEGQRVTGIRLVYAGKTNRTIAGRVVNKESRPVVGAMVRGRCPQGTKAQVETGGDGRYTLDLRPGVLCDITVWHPEYTSGVREEVAVGTHEINFVLDNRGSVEGRVLDARTGKPITRFTVGHRRQDIRDGLDMVSGRPVESGEGRFKLVNVEAGDAVVYALAEGYAPGTLEIRNLRPGEHVSGKTIHLTAGCRIEGTVVDMAGNPIAEARIRLEDHNDAMLRMFTADGGGYPATNSDETGRFLFTTVDPGFQTITAIHRKHPSTATDIALPREGTATIRIVMSGPAVVDGTVFVNGQPTANQEVRITAESDKRNFFTETNQEGAYRIDEIAAGGISVTAAAKHGGQVKFQNKSATARNGYATTVDFSFAFQE